MAGSGRRGRAESDHSAIGEQIRHTRTEIRDQVRATRLQFDEANARITARTGRNLVFAITAGVVLGAAFLASLLFIKVLFLLIAMVLIGTSAFELSTALRQSGRTVPRVGSIVAAVVAQPLAWVLGPQGWLWAIAGAVLLSALWRMVTVRSGGLMRDTGRDLLATVFVQLYVTLLGSCATVLTAQDGGQWWTLTFICVVVATDIFAYVSGLLFGKHPMAPRISPKKTWEGFAGSALAALIVSTVLTITVLRQPVWVGLLLGAVIICTGTAGDLGESLVKRDLGIKDMSSWLPGHGGFLDRVDSILPSSAAALLLFFVVH